MVFDFKKEYKDLYQAKKIPTIVSVPEIPYIAVHGKGDPNAENGEYAEAITLSYAIAYTIRMSHKNGGAIPGYFEYVVPPLEGLWWLADGSAGMDYTAKDRLAWVSLIRLPDFVTQEVFEWAKETVAQKKKRAVSKAEMLVLTERLTAQILHRGPYDDEPATVEVLHTYLETTDYELDLSAIRHPIKKRGNRL